MLYAGTNAAADRAEDDRRQGLHMMFHGVMWSVGGVAVAGVGVALAGGAAFAVVGALAGLIGMADLVRGVRFVSR